jgi:Cytochrome P450
MGRSEQIWENALEFIPERFEIENMTNKSSCTFVVFGAGPRNCELHIKTVQEKFLKAEKVLLTKIFPSFFKRNFS